MAGQPQEQQEGQGQSPLDQARDRGPQDREATPEAPQGAQEKEGQEQPQPQPSGQKESPLPNPLDGDNKEGDPRDHKTGEASQKGDDADQWGALPIRFRERFRNQGREELPVQYRDWIDTYYRRLNSKR